jgi:endonuclease YncB( thermonuclease family)
MATPSEGGTPYPCGLDASHALSKLIGRKPVTCTRRDSDRYGRMVRFAASKEWTSASGW